MPIKTKIKIAATFIVALVLLKFFLAPLKTHFSEQQPFQVRVRLENNIKDLKLFSGTRCVVKDLFSSKVLDRTYRFKNDIMVFPQDEGIMLGDRFFNSKSIRISPVEKGNMEVNSVPYRGEVVITNTGKGLDIINIIELEDYLKGVVPCEMNPFWPIAALKAQAIASRSFAVDAALRNRDKTFDLTDDTFSQVYGGRSKEKWRTTRAIQATKNKVLKYNGEILRTYFHSCCGGNTRSAFDTWGDERSPLKKVKCSWCRWSPHFRWRFKINTNDILAELKDKGYFIDRIDNIIEGERDKAGRLKYVRVKSGNKWFEIMTRDFRSAISKIKSENFRVKKYPRFYLFSGYGWGHGVGMCQWGAFGLSLRRHNEVLILEHYYSGAEIENIGEHEA